MNSTVPASLRLVSDTLDDTEQLRIAIGNRYAQATRPADEVDADGKFRGHGLSDDIAAVRLTGKLLKDVERLEHEFTLGLRREIRKTIYAPWIAEQKGVGEKQIARLLAAIGDPYINEQTGQPRTLRQLWAYAGYAVDGHAARRVRKGASQEEVFAAGRPDAKMRAYLVATSCVKQKGRMREVYDIEREHYAEAVHAVECVRCGPSGKPAQPGTPLSPGHQHARALRRVAKEILRDLWVIARDHHTQV